ncbi:MAG: glycosyltransferase family 4 protein [Pseudomonadota bacterium]
MKIAIVNQYCDLILPPVQNSVGACTYGIARHLAKEADVQVFGLVQDGGPSREVEDQGVRYRLLAPTAMDRRIMYRFDRLAKFYRLFNGGMTIPPSAAGWVYPGYGRAVADAVAADGVDIVFFQHNSQYIPTVRRRANRAKLVLNVHHELYPQCNHRALARRFRHLDQVTAVSAFVADYVARNFPRVTPAPIPVSNGFDMTEFQAAPPQRSGGARIMYAGAVSPEKGVHVLVEAFRTVAGRFPDAHLDIFGSLSSRPLNEVFPQKGDPLLGELVKFYDSDYIAHLKGLLPPDMADRVTFRGNVPREELVRGYYEADIFAFPSLWNEGFGLPPIEAMAAGTPVVATRTGALTETVKDGQTGLLVDRNDPDALAEALCWILQNRGNAADMGQAARLETLAERSWGAAAKKLLEVFSELLAR